LTASAFSVEETGSASSVLRVDNVLNEQTGVAVILTLDTSGSMFGSAIVQSRTAASGFVRGLQSADQAAIVSFSSQVTVQDGLTGDRTSSLAAIDRLAARGDTSLYDAVIESVRQARGAPLPRKAVILLSDGVNVGGTSTRDQAIAAAAEARIPIYTIGLGTAIDRAFLDELARRTGGAFLETPTPDGIVALYDQLSQLLRSQYVISVRSTASPNIEERSLRLTVKTSSGTSQANFDYRTQRTIVALPAPPVEALPPRAVSLEPDNTSGLPLLYLLGGMAAVVAAASVIQVRGRIHNRRLNKAITALSDKARDQLHDASSRPNQGGLSLGGGGASRAVFLDVRRATGETRRFPIATEPATIGTSSSCQLRLDDVGTDVAAEHARVWLRDGKLMFHQIAEGRTSLVGDRPVTWATLDAGDEVSIGDYKLRVEIT
jgi:VWFA-related protein